MLRWSVAEVARVGAGDGLRQGFGDSDEALDRGRTGPVENTLFPWCSGKRFRCPGENVERWSLDTGGLVCRRVSARSALSRSGEEQRQVTTL